MKSNKKKLKNKKITEEAKNKIDSPIKSGGRGPFEFDNSGFAYYCCSTAGIIIPETLKEQSEGGKLVEIPEEGDLLFFDKIGKGNITDVGICIGNNKMIYASLSKGKVVEEDIIPYNNIKTIRRFLDKYKSGEYILLKMRKSHRT